MESLICLFCLLAKIPSPPLQETLVADKITEIFHSLEVDTKKDAYGNVYAKIEATDKTKQPLLLSAHMDVVGDNSPVNIQYSKDKKFIETDKTRTLGADDKAGVATAIWLAKQIKEEKNLKHGGLEILFTRDEEQGMTGIKNADFKSLKSEYVLVLDSDTLGNLEVSGAGYTKLNLIVKTLKGGHSGIDIADSSRINAVKLIAEIMSEIPQGVYKKDETGVITSINAGSIAGGGVKNISTDKQGGEYIDALVKNSMDNIINTRAAAQYSLRSSDLKAEKALTGEIQEIVRNYNEKYKGLAVVELEVTPHLKPFEKSPDTKIIEVVKKASEKSGIPIKISSFHAGAETHIFAHRKNAAGKAFKPYLAGVANIYNMHSPDEKLDVQSLEKGYNLIKNIFYTFNEG